MMFKYILFMLLISLYQCRIPDKVFCVNEQCSEPISKGKTQLRYTSADPDLIPFLSNAEAIIYMKSAGSNQDLWYASINNKLGFVNSKFLREYKVFHKTSDLTSFPLDPTRLQSPVQPDKVQQAHEVFEGTTIFTTESNVNSPADSITETPASSKNEDVTPTLSLAPQEPAPVVETVNENVPTEVVSPMTSLPENLQLPLNFVPNESLDNSDGKNVIDTNQISKANQVPQEMNSQETVSEPPQVLNQHIPPIPAPELIVSGSSGDELGPVNLVEVPEKDDNLQPIAKTEEKDNTEDVSTSATEVDAQLPVETQTATILEPGLNNNGFITKPEGVPIGEESKIDNVKPSNNPESVVDMNVADPQLLLQVPQNVDNPLPSPAQKTDTSTTTSETVDVPQSTIPPIIQETPKPILNLDLLGLNNLLTNPSTELPPTEVKKPPSNYLFQNKDIPVAPQENSIFSNLPTQAPSVQESTTENNYVPTAGPPVVSNTQENSIFSFPTTQAPSVQEPSSETNYGPTTSAPIIPKTQSTEAVNNEINLSLKSTETEPPPSMSSDTLSTEDIFSFPTTQAPSVEKPSSETNYGPTTSAPIISETQSTEAVNNEINLSLESTETEPPPSMSSDTLSTEEFIEDIFTSTTKKPVVQEDKSEGFLSNIFSTVSDLWPTTTEKPLTENLFNPHSHHSVRPQPEVDEGFSFVRFLSRFMSGPKEETKAIFASAGGACFTEDYCDGTSNDQSNRLLTFLLTTAASVLLFTLGYYYIDIKRQDGRLIGTINSLQRDLLFTTKECEILKEELTATKTKLAGIEDSSFGMDDMVQSLKEEIEEMKAQNERLRRSLDDNEKLLRVSENTAGELQNTLGEVENTLSELLAERANSDEHINELNGKLQAFEEELISVSRERDNFQLKYVSAEAALEDAKKQMKQLEDVTQKLADANNTIELQKHEITALKDAIKDLKNGLSPNVDVTSFIDHTEIKAKLAKALEEKQSFEKKFEIEHKERKRLDETLQSTQESLQTTSQQATEALTRLEVLGKYFQERETELMKELSTKETLWLSKQGESASTVEKIELLQQEIQRYKEKCDALALELAEQESMRRTAVGEVEARSHAAWLEARQARREADAARDEAAALRRKLASVAADGAASPHHKVVSPLDTSEVPPPLPLGFLPPPLLPPLPRAPPLLPPLPRPPPLGRLPSPHPPRYGDRRYSPDSRYSPQSRYSPESRYSPDTVRYSPDSRYSPRRRSPYEPRTRRRSSRDRYEALPAPRSRPAAAPDTETEYNSDSPERAPRRRRRYSRHEGPSSGSGCSSESDK